MDEPISSRLKTHKELMAALTAVHSSGVVTFLPNGTPVNIEIMFGPENVNSEFHALLASAHMLYRVSAHCRDMLEILSVYLENHGHEEVVASVLSHQAALHTAMLCATEGHEKVLKRRD
jgi:hypothetical protein